MHKIVVVVFAVALGLATAACGESGPRAPEVAPERTSIVAGAGSASSPRYRAHVRVGAR